MILWSIPNILRRSGELVIKLKIKNKEITNHSNLKQEKKKNSNYSKLKIKVFLRTLGMIVLAFCIIFTLYRRFWFGRVGDWIVIFLQNVFHLDYMDARNIYQYGLRENMSMIIFLAVTFCFLVLFWVSLSWFTRYFNEIDTGLEKLIQGENREILLSPEMAPMEQKLNVLRQALERRELEAKLAEERKNNLVMYLAHDIRTPLTSVVGYLSLLEEAPDMPVEQKAKYVHITLEKANRLEQLINEFFEITRYNIQQIVLEKEEIDLYYMLLQMIEEFYPLLAQKKNQAQLHGDENVTVFGDPIKLARVFNNILKNAVAYSYENTQIDIFLEEKQSGEVVVRFQNHGKTIPKEKLTSIFEKFYRMDEARNSDTGGAGLGLAIAKEIVTLHGGKISAESEQEQVVFVVELPKS
ncbi:MAG: vancomycin resistance histidine kinase VanS [Lachnospiraceae bacterium]|nr:vancomycin resistance histidine kinase VanS [Lachnospiraceae bacterium]